MNNTTNNKQHHYYSTQSHSTSDTFIQNNTIPNTHNYRSSNFSSFINYSSSNNNYYHSKHFLNIFSWNCNKLSGDRLVEFRLFLSDNDADIVCLNELKLNEQECNADLRFDGYRTFSRPRAGDSASFGGGVCVLVREFIQVDDWAIDDEAEAISISIKLNNFCFKLLCYYNPPYYKNLSSRLLDSFLSDNIGRLILGDLNSKHTIFGCQSTNPDGRLLDEIISKHNLIFLNNDDPTFFQYSSDH